MSEVYDSTNHEDDEGGTGDNQNQMEVGRPLFPDVKLSFSQLHGKMNDNEVTEGDVISSMQYNQSGDLLAVGDRGGRITLYSRQHDKNCKHVNYQPYLEFQSHDPEFDYLKSVEIEERITQVKWVPRTAQAHFILSTNDKTVKLWRIGVEQKVNSVDNLNLNRKSITSLSLPRIVKAPAQATATLRKLYGNTHAFHINSISVNSDQETFLSADDLRINLWNLEVTDQSFVIVDIKPENMDYLQEVITSATFHPSRCNLFCYGSSKGTTKLCDMRASALCDKHAKLFHYPDFNHDTGRRIFSEIIGSICDAKFSNSGRYLATRDYLNIRVWDTQMENKPLATYPVHDYLEPHLCSLYENDSIFDKFNVSWSGSDTRLVTGSYHSMFRIVDRVASKSILLETQNEPKLSANSKALILKPKRVIDTMSVGYSAMNATGKLRKEGEEILLSNMDFNKKALLTDWHPKENVLTVATNNNLFFFQDRRLYD